MSFFKKLGEGIGKAEREEKPGVGTHLVAIDTFDTFGTQEYGTVPKVRYRIYDSRTEEKGAIRGDIWFINATGWSGKYAINDFWSFMRAVVSGLGGNATSMDELKETAADLAELTDSDVSPKSDRQYPGRGILVRVTARIEQYVDKNTKQSKESLKVSYEGVKQTPEDIARVREWLEGGADAQAPAVEVDTAPRKSLLGSRKASELAIG